MKRTLKTKSAVIGVLLCLTAGTAWAQGAGSPAPIPRPTVEEQYLQLIGQPQSAGDAYGAALGGLVAKDPSALFGPDGKLPDEPTLLRIVEGLPFEDSGFHVIPSVYKTICAPIYQAHGQDWGFYRALPPRARLIMATYLATQNQGEAMESLLSSLTAEEWQALPQGNFFPGYAVGYTLDLEHKRELLPLIIWMWKDQATRLGGSAPASVAWDLVAACQRYGNKDLMTREAIPWTERALNEPGNEAWWDSMIPALIQAYDFMGEREKAVQQGEYWLGQAPDRGVPGGLPRTEYYLARKLEKTDYQQAAERLRDIIGGSGKEWAEAAQEELLKLAEVHSDLTNVEIVPAQFRRIWPEKVNVIVSFMQSATRTLIANGNSTCRITGSSCDLAGVKVAVSERKFQGSGSWQEVSLALGAFDKPGAQSGNLILETNDGKQPRISVPIRVEVQNPVTVTPGSFFFGFIKPGETKTCTVTIESAVPFQVREVKVDKPEVLEAEIVRQGDRSYAVSMTLQSLQTPGEGEGTVEIMTDLLSQPTVKVGYFGAISPGI